MAAKEDWKSHKAQVLARLRRAEGQVRAVQAMVEREDDCESVIQQLAASRKALDRAFYDLIGCMMQRQLTEAGGLNQAAQNSIGEMRELLARYG